MITPSAAAATRLMEIGLTATLFAVPSSVLAGAMGPYDEPKAWALVTLVGLTALAWLAAHVSGAARITGPRPDHALRTVRWLLLLYGVWWAWATALSIVPGQSMWGGFGRGFGLVASLAALVLFAVVQTDFRTLDRIGHLIDRALIGSLPVIVLAMGQALGWDPLPGGWDPATVAIRVRSTFGQHIFLGSYLVALIPLCAGRLMVARRQGGQLSGTHSAMAVTWVLGTVATLAAPHGVLPWLASLAWSVAGAAAWNLAPARWPVRLPPWWRVAMLGSLMATQALVLVLSTARGAFVGLLTGLVGASVVLLVSRRAYRTLVLLASGVLSVVLVLGVLNLPDSPLERLKEIQVFSRLGSIADVRERSPGWVRLRLWEGILSHWPRQLAGEEVVPGLPAPLRALVGFGPETQIFVLDRFLPIGLRSLLTRHGDWSALYMFDRAHNELLDHLVTLGVIGTVLWLGLVGILVATGVVRLYAASGTIEAGIRFGCLATVLGQAVEGLFGIASPMPRALFWIAAGILTLPVPIPPTIVLAAPRLPATAGWRRPWPSLALLGGASVLAVVVIVADTRWFLGSMAYAAGIRRGLEGDLPTARRDFLRAVHLAPWVPFPAEAAANVSLRLTVARVHAASRTDWLAEAEEALAQARGWAPSRSDLWRLSAQVGLARMRSGQPGRLNQALRDFSEAARLRPGDPEILTQWALALVQNGDPAGARRLAEEALANDRQAWLAWAVLARSHEQLGTGSEARRSAEEARRLAPEASREIVERLLP